MRLHKLHIRILVPFIALFVGMSLISLFITSDYISNMLEDRIKRETDRIVTVLSNSEFVLNPLYVQRLKALIEGEILVTGEGREIIVSTMEGGFEQTVKGLFDAKDILQRLNAGSDGQIRDKIVHDQRSYMLTARKLPIAGDSPRALILTVLYPLDDLAAAQQNVTGALFLIGACALLLTVLLAYLISRSLSKPIENLVGVTNSIAQGEYDTQAPIPAIDELGRLATSINTMSAKIRASEQQIIQSCQLAAAGKVTAAMAHEIRNPLSSIKMLAQVIRDRHTHDADTVKLIKPLLEEIQRLEKIIEDLTTQMKPGALSLRPTDINTLIEETFAVIRPKLAHRKIDVIQDLAPDLPNPSVDRDRVKQVIWNLTLNAMESMPEGGRITIATTSTPDQNGIEIAICDEGCGLRMQNTQELFQPFYTTKAEGLGLGLYTSRKIVELHQGRLTLTHQPEAGVKASVMLPMG